MRIRRRVASLAIFIVAAATLGLLSPSSSLAADPPWEPDLNSAAPYGNIVFYDSTGNVVIGGNDLSHIADYAVATSGPDSGATQATLFFAAPDHTQPTGNWFTDFASSGTPFPNSSAPAPIDGFTEPVVTLGPTDADLSVFLSGIVKDTTAGYADIYQVRLKDSGPGGAGSGAKYWSTDIMVDEGAGTWTQVYPLIGPPNWLPVLSGPHRIGGRESCLASFDIADSITYAWYQNDVLIPGADKATYTPPEGYFGKDLSCQVTASNAAGEVGATSVSHTLGVGAALVPTKKPFLYHGTNRTTAPNGQFEYVDHGTWSPAATSYAYQWYVGTSKINGATASRFKPPSSYIGKTISCRVTAKRLHWADGVYKTAGVKVT